MILLDSVFILEWILRRSDGETAIEYLLMGMSSIEFAVMGWDLLLLENQLPYFILQELFESIVPTLIPEKTFREIVITFFGFQNRIENNSNFKHFTDLWRLFYLDTLPPTVLDHGEWRRVACLDNAYKLDSGGVELEAVEKDLLERRRVPRVYNAYKLDSGGVKLERVEEFSLFVRFENGCLKIPFLRIVESFEIKIRNLMAFELCHDPLNTHVCNYISFMDDLIDTDKDVEFLIDKGIIENHIGHHGSVAKMFNKLCLGIYLNGRDDSYKNDIAIAMADYYSDPIKKLLFIVKKTYFADPFIMMAKIIGAILLLLTFIQAITSIMQVTQKK